MSTEESKVTVYNNVSGWYCRRYFGNQKKFSESPGPESGPLLPFAIKIGIDLRPSGNRYDVS